MKFQTYSEINSLMLDLNITSTRQMLTSTVTPKCVLCRNQGIWTSHNIKMLNHNTQIFKPALNYYLLAQSFSSTALTWNLML